MTPRDDSSPPSRARTLGINAIKAAVSIGLLAVLFSRVDLARLWSVARQASPAWLALALLLYFAMVLSSVLRWGILLRAQHLRLPYTFLTQSFLVATFFNNFLPSNIGGDVVRISDTAKAAGSVVGAGVDAVTTSDAETRARAEREQREWEREQRRCEQRQRQGKRC